jgi:hypothetical protein
MRKHWMPKDWTYAVPCVSVIPGLSEVPLPCFACRLPLGVAGKLFGFDTSLNLNRPA